jgi:hypothetical protein
MPVLLVILIVLIAIFPHSTAVLSRRLGVALSQIWSAFLDGLHESKK